MCTASPSNPSTSSSLSCTSPSDAPDPSPSTPAAACGLLPNVPPAKRSASCVWTRTRTQSQHDLYMSRDNQPPSVSPDLGPKRSSYMAAAPTSSSCSSPVNASPASNNGGEQKPPEREGWRDTHLSLACACAPVWVCRLLKRPQQIDPAGPPSQPLQQVSMPVKRYPPILNRQQPARKRATSPSSVAASSSPSLSPSTQRREFSSSDPT